MELYRKLAAKLNQVKGLKLAGNVAHQKAFLVGLLIFLQEADALISLDADLQVNLIILLKRWQLLSGMGNFI